MSLDLLLKEAVTMATRAMPKPAIPPTRPSPLTHTAPAQPLGLASTQAARPSALAGTPAPAPATPGLPAGYSHSVSNLVDQRYQLHTDPATGMKRTAPLSGFEQERQQNLRQRAGHLHADVRDIGGFDREGTLDTKYRARPEVALPPGAPLRPGQENEIRGRLYNAGPSNTGGFKRPPTPGEFGGDHNLSDHSNVADYRVAQYVNQARQRAQAIPQAIGPKQAAERDALRRYGLLRDRA